MRRHRRYLARNALAAVLLLWAAAATAQLAPDGGELVPVGKPGSYKDYLWVGPEGVEIPLYGPGDLSGWVRGHFAPGEEGERTRRLLLKGVPGIAVADTFSFEPSSVSEYGDGRPGAPSGGRKLSPRRLPAGAYTLELVAPDGPVLTRLDWEPDPAAAGIRPAGVAAIPEPKEENPWKTGGSLGLETIYDDNFLRYSDDYLDDFNAGLYPYKFKIDQQDSYIFAPSLNVWARRRFLDAGDTKFDFRFKRWQYVEGSIKSNMAFDYGIRQYLGGGKSLEIGYSYAPEQYIRQLSDRPPTVAHTVELTWEEFRYTRNVFELIWRQKLRRNMNLKLWLTRSLRYYNRAFMENDVEDLGLRATIYWSVHRDWRLTLDYGYTDAPARGYDEVGETRETSDDSDPSYNRDLYQLDVRWDPRWLKPYLDEVSLRGGYQAYYFTSTKPLDEDPYHRGRIDHVYWFQFDTARGITDDVDATFGVRLTVRTVESPWTGEIAEDKDYDQRRYWIGLTYKL